MKIILLFGGMLITRKKWDGPIVQIKLKALPLVNNIFVVAKINATVGERLQGYDKIVA